MSERHDDDYVTNSAWVRLVGRPDVIDEIADQFERPVAVGMTAFWSAGSGPRWPRTSQGWRSIDRLHARTGARRAG